MSKGTCILDGCDKTARSAAPSLCPMHYHRQYRHGDVNALANTSGVTVSKGRRYRTARAPGHPLAGKSGVVYVHRMVLFDSIGPGVHACHWCNTAVEWAPKGHPRELQPDHLNGDGADNGIDNLVPSCRRCNTARAQQARSDALRAAGFWSGSDTIAGLRSGGRAARVGHASRVADALG